MVMLRGTGYGMVLICSIGGRKHTREQPGTNHIPVEWRTKDYPCNLRFEVCSAQPKEPRSSSVSGSCIRLICCSWV
jgi:hypothetical protein